MPEGTTEGTYNFDLFKHSTIKEIKDEMGLDPSQYRLFPIAIARELPRGGKPQLFWVALTDLSTAELAEFARNAREKREFLFPDAGDVFESFSDNSQDDVERFTYEGWAALWLSQKFISANETKL